MSESSLAPADADALCRLEACLRGTPEPIIAFSGGLDSRFLAHTAARVGVRPLLVHMAGPHVSAEETAEARRWASRNGFRLHCVAFDPLELPEVATGRSERCYFCKRAMFALLREMPQAAEKRSLWDGTNASDLSLFRPGLRALAEAEVRSPLAETGVDKACVRRLARATGLEHPEQQARPCLLTRLPYGMMPSRALLLCIADMETAVEDVLRSWAESNGETPDFRIRAAADGSFALHAALAGLDAAAVHRLKTDLHRALQKAGLPGAEVFLTAAVSGYFDRAAEIPYHG